MPKAAHARPRVAAASRWRKGLGLKDEDFWIRAWNLGSGL